MERNSTHRDEHLEHLGKDRMSRLIRSNTDSQGESIRQNQAEEMLRLQRDIALTLSTERDLTTALERLLDVVLQMAPLDCGGIYLFDESTGDLNLVAHKGLSSSFVKRASHYTAESRQVHFVMAGKPIYQCYAKMLPSIKEAGQQQEGLRALAIIPVQYEDRVVAVLNLASHTQTEIPLDIRNALDTIAVQIGGILARVRAEENLHLLQKAIETTGIGITITNSEGKIVYTNPADAKMHGYTIHELLGKPSNIFTAPELRQGTSRYDNSEIFYDWERERINMRKDGSTFPVRLTSAPIYDTQKFRIGTVTICENITEQKRTEEELRRAKEAAEAANQAKSIFLANMSHELRTPLNAILGFTQIMARNPDIPPDERENLEIIQHSGEHLLTLINQVLDLSKIEAGRLTLNEAEVNLYSLLEELEDMFCLRIQRKGVHLLFERADDLPHYIRTDEIKLRQVLINLLNNAIKFTEEGGVTVRVKRASSEQPPTDACSLNTEYCVLVFEVEDTGPGIAPDELANLFDTFTQTKTGQKTREGTGLGLAISRRFVQLMNGNITVKSTPGQGTIFTFWIQAASMEQPRSDKQWSKITKRVIALESAQPRYRILVVDDKPDNRKLLVKLLDPFGFDIQEAANGQEALDIWELWEPHVIWMDMRMPVMDGYEASQRIRETEGEIQKTYPSEFRTLQKADRTIIIAVTASSFEEEQVIARAVGCDDFLRKPFRENTVFELLHKHLEVRFVYEEENTVGKGRKPAKQDVLTSAAFAALPIELLKKLEHAVIIADISKIERLVKDVREHNMLLADAICKRIENYEYGEILSAIQEAMYTKRILKFPKR